MSTDLDIIAKALAAGREAATAYKNFQRDANGYQYAQDKLVKIYAGMDALQRLAKLPPPAPLAFGHSAGLTPEYKAAQQAKNEAAAVSLAKAAAALSLPAPDAW